SRRPAAPPTCHVVRLGYRVELDRYVASAIDLEDARRRIAVVCELRVSIVVHQQDIEFPAPCNDSLEVIAWRDSSGRIVRIIQIEYPRAAQNVGRDLVEVNEKIIFGTKRVGLGRTIREDRSTEVAHVSGLWND